MGFQCEVSSLYRSMGDIRKQPIIAEMTHINLLNKGVSEFTFRPNPKSGNRNIITGRNERVPVCFSNPK